MRWSVPLVAAIALAGCGSVNVGSLGYNGATRDVGGLAGRSATTPAVRVAELAPTNESVAVDSSGKAPKGALADRDYTAAALDAEAAVRAINAYRSENGLQPLKLDARLTVAAKTHSRDLAKGDRISHYGSDGSSPWDRVARTGYAAALAAENVGTGQASLEEVIKGWKASESHNKNLLLADAEDMGIALVREPKSEFKTFWTLVVGAAQR